MISRFSNSGSHVSRTPVVSERLALTVSGQVRYTLETPYRDGTTHLVLEPLELMARLAALVPPPRAPDPLPRRVRAAQPAARGGDAGAAGHWRRRSIRSRIRPSRRHRGTWR
jgi:hypothetical protein